MNRDHDSGGNNNNNNGQGRKNTCTCTFDKWPPAHELRKKTTTQNSVHIAESSEKGKTKSPSLRGGEDREGRKRGEEECMREREREKLPPTE